MNEATLAETHRRLQTLLKDIDRLVPRGPDQITLRRAMRRQALQLTGQVVAFATLEGETKK